MKKSWSLVWVGLFLMSILSFGFQPQVAGAKDAKILEFDTMAGVPRPYTRNNGNAIRGIDGGGLPWVIAGAKGELKQDGKLEVKVTGLVFDPNDPGTIAAGVAGINTVPNFKAIVSCLSKDASGNAVTVNVSTDNFPADSAGNAEIEAQLVLPQPCIAPIVFVTSPTGLWFAASGY